MTTLSVLSIPGSDAVPKSVEAVRDNTAKEEHPSLTSEWSIGKNKNCLALTEPAEFEEWAGEL
jgi:hypothetical protein